MMTDNLYFSFVMGFDDKILDLKKDDFKVEKNGKNYLISFSKEKADIFEKYIIENMQPGFWNEYIGEAIVFIFKFKNGKIQKYIYDENTHDTILKLCCEFANVQFTSIKEMLAGNDFYKDKIGKTHI